MLEFFTSMTFLENVKYLVSTLLFLLAMWGVIHFFPRSTERGDTGPSWLILAIWLGFLGSGLNALAWRVLGDPLLFYNVLSVDTYLTLGYFFGDLIGKGLAVISIYMHFYARWASLPDDEKEDWYPLLMGYYPDKTKLAYRALRLMLFKRRSTKSTNKS